MKTVVPRLYGQSGPIIMVQVENEYGAFNSTKDGDSYKNWLRDEIS